MPNVPGSSFRVLDLLPSSWPGLLRTCRQINAETAHLLILRSHFWLYFLGALRLWLAYLVTMRTNIKTIRFSIADCVFITNKDGRNSDIVEALPHLKYLELTFRYELLPSTPLV
jgi:hypothetical protein